MAYQSKRITWSTNLKQYIANGYYETLPYQIKKKISSSNKSRWIHQPHNKYEDGGLENQIILYNHLENSPKIKQVLQCYFELNNVLHQVINNTTSIKQHVSQHKETIVNAIEKTKHIIPVA